jgi:hypothetical protein
MFAAGFSDGGLGKASGASRWTKLRAVVGGGARRGVRYGKNNPEVKKVAEKVVVDKVAMEAGRTTLAAGDRCRLFSNLNIGLLTESSEG